MSIHHNLRRTPILLLLISLLLPAVSVLAEGAGRVTITNPDTSKFPSITTYLNAFNEQGGFITDLKASQVSVIENGEQIALDRLDSLETPLSFVLAINSDPALAVRDGLGDSRYTKILAALSSWASVRPATSQDKLAVVWNGGVIASRLSPAAWQTRLESFDPSLRTSTTGLAALAFALDAAQEAESGPGTKKTILLISGHLGQKDLASLEELTTRAKQSSVRVFVWIVDTKSYFDNPGSLALEKLALDTGGQSITYTGAEDLPNLETWFASLRIVYQLAYTSKIREGGQHILSVQVNTPNLAIASDSLNFPLELQVPSATLLSPPINIVRQNPDSPFDLSSFTPTEQEISILVEFPDKRQRPLKRSTLYVDDTIIAENTAEPFTSFKWDLRGYLASAEHMLKVEIEDNLGLTQMSAEVPVQVTIVQPPGGMAGLILRNRTAVTITFMVLAGAVVLGIIILGGRRGLATLAQRRKTRTDKFDPVTQPVHFKNEVNNASRANPFPWLRRKETPPPAYFARLTLDGAPGKGDPIPLNGREITFGTDPTQATIVLTQPSLSLLHARLRRTETNAFVLLDQNSTAGTWVNYERIPLEGCLLKHGDVIHFGQLSFRFVLAKPPAAVKPTLTPIKDG